MKLSKLFSVLRNAPKLYTLGGSALVVVVAVVGVHALTRSAPAPTDVSNTTHVTTASVASLASQTAPLPVTGKVTSQSQATILSQTSGEIVRLSHGIGDAVAAGSVIAEFENSSQRAAVLQAQGSFDAATAAYAKASGSTAVNSTVTSAQALQNVSNSKASAQAALHSAYAALDDAIHAKADTLFSNPKTAQPKLILIVPDSALVQKIQSDRVTLETTLAEASSLSTSANIDDAISQMIVDAQVTGAFLNNLITAVNETPESASVSTTILAGYQTSLGTARSEVTGAVTSLAAAKSAYDSAVATAATTANSAQSGSENDIAAAAASVKQAQGALDGAEAALEKTIVRSPISGTIVSLPITRGDYVASFSQVAVVSNPSAVYIDVAVTPDDAKTLAVGGKATVNGSLQGVITFIAPALDPLSGKIEVKVGLTKDTGGLTDGQVVTLALDRAHAAPTATSTTIAIPIVAVKILPSGPVVFSVTASSTLAAQAITLGSILGDRVVITSGLTPDLTIVTDARGLAEGQSVVVDTH